MSSYIDEKIRMKRVVFFALVVSFLFFFFNMIGVSALFYIGLAGLLVSMLALSEKELFLLISFLMPNLFMFKQIGSESAILGYFFVLISIKTVIMNFQRTVRINLFFIVHIAFTLLTCTIYADQNLLIGLVRFVFNFSLFSYCASLFSRDREIKQVVKMYFAGIIIAVLMGIVFHSANGDLYNGLFAGVNSGRNYFGAVITPAITIIILYFLEKRVSFSETILYGLTMILCMISIVLSGSRTSVLSLAIPILLCLFCLIRSLWKFNKKLLPLIILLAVFGIVVYVNYQDALLNLLARFSEDDVKTGNNRFDLWEYYIKQTLRSPISFMLGSGSINDNKLVEHNTVVQCIYQLGVIGFISFLGIILKAFRKITKGYKLSIITIFPLLSVIIPYCGINGLYADQLSYLIVLCALIMRDFSITKNVDTANCNVTC